MKLMIFLILMVFVVALVATGLIGLKSYYDHKENMRMEKLRKQRGFINPIVSVFLVLGGVLLFFAFILFSPFESVSTGYVGIETRMGRVTGTVYPPGFHVISPLSDLHELSTMVEARTNEYATNTIDNQQINIKMTVNFSISPEKATDLFQHINGDFYQVIILPAAQEVLKSQIALLRVNDVLAKRPEIKERVHAGMTEWTSKYGIIINEVSIADVTFSKEYMDAIERKQIEEQKALQKTYQLAQAQKDAEIAEATAIGAAKALKAEADARAYYNEKTAVSATDKVVALKYLDKWDGKLPIYMMGENPNILMSMGGAK